MNGVDKELSEHIRAELESQMRILAKTILAEQAQRRAAAADNSSAVMSGTGKCRFRRNRAAM